MVMVTSAAKHSIRRDLHRGHGVVREGTPAKQLSQLVSPTAHPPYIIVLSKSKSPDCIHLQKTPLSMDRWLIIAPAVV